MIEQVLIFSLGLLIGGLIWLMLLPAFWRRAVRLTRQKIELSLPLSANEIAAERDRIRAEAAVRVIQLERNAERMLAEVAAAKTETGERFKAEAGFLRRIAADDQRIAALEAERDTLLDRVDALEADLVVMTNARDIANAMIGGLEMQREGLVAKLGAMTDLAEQRRIDLDDALVAAERAREALDAEAARSAHLRSELQASQIEAREQERRVEALENDAALARIRRGEIRAVEFDAPEPANLRVPEQTIKAAS